MDATGRRIAVLGVVLIAIVPAVQAAPQAARAKPFAAKGPAPVFAPLRTPPASAIILFNGKDLRGWHQRYGKPAAFKVKDGVMTTASGDIVTDRKFTDAIIHVEFREPKEPAPERGNSGVYVQGRYEIQVLDTYGVKIPGKGSCGAIYDQFAPLANASKPPLEWQSFDIISRAPRVDASGKVTQGRLTVLQNDVLIHNNVEVLGPTGSALDDKVMEPGPLLLQYHGSAVDYRNVWLVPLPLQGSDTYEGR
jgi:hypothetical protein